MAYKVLKPNTRQYNFYINEYLRSYWTRLEDCYKNFSYNKERVYYTIYEEMQRYNGHGMRILSRNCFFFTIAYIVETNLIVETPSNTYVLSLPLSMINE